MKRILPDMKTGFRDDGGQALVIAVLSMMVLMGFLGLAIDVGNLRSAERKLQETADAAALAGALEISYCDGYTAGGGTFCPVMQNAATAAMSENGFSSPTVDTNTCTTPKITGATLVLNWYPCLMGSTTKDPNYHSGTVVEAQAGQLYPTYFAGLLGISNPVPITVRAEAARGKSGYCMYVDTKDDGKTGTGTLDIESGGQLSLGCGVQDDGTLLSKNGSHLTATQFEVSASSGTNSNQFNPSPSFGAPQVPDPVCATYTYDSSANHTSNCGTITYASPAPTAGGSSAPSATPTGCQTLTTSPIASSLAPGCYWNPNPSSCSSGKNKTSNGVCDAVTLSGGGTLQPGTYIFNGNFNIGNFDITSGTGGTTFYFMNGSITNAGGSRLTLNAPTGPPPTGPDMTAMLIWMDPQNLTTFPMASGSQSIWNGIIYDEYGTVDLSDGAIAASGCTGNYTILDAASVTAQHGGKLNINLCSDFSNLANGNPINGYTAVLVE